MANDTTYKSGGDDDIIITIPSQVKKNLPGDFDIGEIGKIDLREAESIASEDILFLNEGDLIEGLEDFDLIPLAGAPGREGDKDRGTRPPEGMPAATAERDSSTSRERLIVEADEGRQSDEPAADDGRRWVPLERLDRIDEEGREWTPLEEVLADVAREKAETEPAAPVPLPTERIEPVIDDRRGPMDERDLLLATAIEAGAMPVAGEGFDHDRDEYIIMDLGEHAADMRGTVAPQLLSGKAAVSEPAPPAKKEERVVPEGVEILTGPEAGETDGIAFVALEDGALLPAKSREAVYETAPVRAVPPVERYEADVREAVVPEIAPAPEPAKPVFIDAGEHPVPKPFATSDARVYFIDDAGAPDAPGDDIFDEIKLDKIISGTAQVDEGVSYLLHEADIIEDRERIVHVKGEMRPAHAEEVFVDLAYRYGDEDLDYVHTTIVEDDYGDYMKGIDELFGAGAKAVPEAVELLGLTVDEFDTIEDLLFRDEMKDINRYDRYGLYQFDRATREAEAEGRSFRYLLPTEESLMDIERTSIESDVSSSSALIFEEDVETIREYFRTMTGKTDVDAGAEQEPAGEGGPVVDEVMAPEFQEGPSIRLDLTLDDEVRDITDRVVILDDQEDVERFVREFPERKQTDIRMLLKYLDGLFERLPEEIIRKFASSEYFELYLKVLNEMGV